jgi:two-component system sensor histidine kinase KdpD
MRLRNRGLDTLLAVAVVAVVSLLIAVAESYSHVSNISNLYIIGIAVLAARRGLYPAVLASMMAFLAFDWFFVPPIHVFTVDDPSEYVALATLLVTGVVIGQLLTTVRRSATEAQARQRHTQLLYDVSQAALSESNVGAVYKLALDRLNETLGLPWSRVLTRGEMGFEQVVYSGFNAPSLPDETHWLQRVAEEGLTLGVWEQFENHVRMVRELDISSGRVASSEGGTLRQVYVPLRIESRVEGVLVVGTRATDEPLSHEERQLLLAFANQLAIAVQRDRLADEQAHWRAIEESDRLKSALVSSVSHELKTPLAAIKASATSLLQDGYRDPLDPHRELAQSIDRETDRLTKLVANLLDMSRLESGGLQPHLELTSIADVVADVLDRMEPILHDRPIDVNVPEDLPPTPLDFVLISQVVTNLLDNAVRYSSPGAPISLSAEIAREQLRVTVFNEGSHIPRAELDKLFEKFYRVSTNTGGTGLGLAIVRGIVETHGGRIWAENVGRRGVAFTFTLPSPPIDSAHRDLPAPLAERTAGQDAASANGRVS